MGKNLIEIFNLLAIISVVIFPFFNARKLAIAAIATIVSQVIISMTLVYHVFTGEAIKYSYSGSFVTGDINIQVDYLSAWFILIISFTFLTGAIYGIHYMKKYREQTSNLILHATAFVLAYTALINICMTQNAIVFLVVWEIMALSSFILIIFEHDKKETLRSGINFLIQSHVSILFLTIAFIWIKAETGSFDFAAISSYTTLHPRMGLILFGIFLIGFFIKAGFVPFHTWLPLAHPAAPSHISGIMSGVIIKIGIFGMLRILLLMNINFTVIGIFLIIISVITGIFGVVMAIVQNNLKRLLAYSSIENIGIIGLGIGLGCLGKGMNQPSLILAGFGGALLHVLNHSLFKSLLFYNAGNVYHSTHNLNLDSLGGLIKKIPQTSYFFLIGSLAICGFPPFNGFVSEYLIYNGLFAGFHSDQSLFSLTMLFSIFSLVIIGGLALIAFTKTFGMIFLGNSRQEMHVDETIDKSSGASSLYLIVSAMLFVGLFPFLISNILFTVSALFTVGSEPFQAVSLNQSMNNITFVGAYSLAFILLAFVFIYLRSIITTKYSVKTNSTWGCGYVAQVEKAQYTGKSYSRTLAKLLGFVVKEQYSFDSKPGKEIYPKYRKVSSHYADLWEKYLVMPPIRWFSIILDYFKFIQNGNIQSYVVYGLLFILIIVMVSMLSMINLVI